MKENIKAIIKSEELKDLTIDIADQAIDNKVTEEILDGTPILKYISSAIKVYSSYSDKIYLKKAMHVLLEIGDVNWKERVEFIRKLDDENSSGIEKILLSIDKLETIRKCKVFGRLCKLNALVKIDVNRFLRLTKLIQDSYLEDLKLLPYFISQQKNNQQKYFNEEEFVPLVALGLIYIQRSEREPNEKIEEYSKWNPEIKGCDVLK
ncbi:hypothetical protein [uncultured Aquimarina sp.]|uniref:hypothetical protein n=1 Tax=uncultured Aquimarina sp. TaxID=575652 RepID=UPI00260D1FB4|nr:hypothetical protein [uncultured Aquimarina sp.]